MVVRRPLKARNNWMVDIHSCSLYHNCRLIWGPRIYPAHRCETIFSGAVHSEKSDTAQPDGMHSNGFPVCSFLTDRNASTASMLDS